MRLHIYHADCLRLQESQTVDHMVRTGKISSDIYVLSIRLWDVLLFFSLLQKPRRDPGIMNDMAFTLTRLAFKMLPKAVFPYDRVPMTRVDMVDSSQIVMNIRDNMTDSNETIIRFKNPSIVTSSFLMECRGHCQTSALEVSFFV